MSTDETTLGGQTRDFPTTCWTVVLHARDSNDPQSRESWDWLIAHYWKAVYGFIRQKWTKSNEEAKDLTQGFFLALMERHQLGAGDQASFRAFLKTALQHFLLDDLRRSNALKRGGPARPLSLDGAEPPVPAPDLSPEEVFDRQWSMSLLERCVGEMKRFFDEHQHPLHFEVFRAYYLDREGHLSLKDTAAGGAGEKRPTYAQVAERLGVSETDVRNWLMAARNELRRILRSRIRQYVREEGDIEPELKYLLEL